MSDSKKNPAREKFLPMLSPFVDGELSAEERVQVEQHLAANKESAMQVADFRAASGLLRHSMEMLADEVDFKDFANEVMAKVTPDRLPLLERLKLELTELFTWKRPMMLTSLATAAAVLLVAVPVAMKVGAASVGPGYANERVEVQAVKVESAAKVAPVVMETDTGDAIIWMVDAPEKKDDAGAPDQKSRTGEETEEELGVDPAGQPNKQGPL